MFDAVRCVVGHDGDPTGRADQRHGLVETSTRGYFETLTRAWLVLVTDARLRTRATASHELLERTLPGRYYSKELLATPRARSIFVAPDRAPLPEVP